MKNSCFLCCTSIPQVSKLVHVSYSWTILNFGDVKNLIYSLVSKEMTEFDDKATTFVRVSIGHVSELCALSVITTPQYGLRLDTVHTE